MKNAILPNYFTNLALNFLDEALAEVTLSTYVSRDGEKINLFKLGDPKSEKLVLLPPYGMSFLLLSRLAKSLSRYFYVLSWESKGCPDFAVKMSEDDLSLATQANYFLNILDQEQFEQFHFVGWCQAAQLLVYTLFHHDVNPHTVSWIAPAGLGFSLLESEFERCALPIYLQIAEKGAGYAEKLSVILDKYRDQKLTEVIAAEKFTMMHLSSVEMTCRFSKYMRAYEENKLIVNQQVKDVINNNRVLIIHCKDDTYSHYSEAVQLEKKFCDQINLHLLPEGGHLQLFNQPLQITDILRSNLLISSGNVI